MTNDTQTTQATDTPMLRQYKAIKANYMDAILFFRLGDFYEMFLDDAKISSKELELTLTGRGKNESRIPMCGVPHHAAHNYITRLVSKGYKVAICEQTEEATQGKGITKREVVKVVTPGTVLEHGTISEKENNYIAAINPILKTEKYGMSFADITTGEFKTYIVSDKNDIMTQIEQLNLKEIIIPLETDLTFAPEILTNTLPFLDSSRAAEELCQHFKINSLSAFGIDHLIDALPSAWQLLSYIKTTQKNQAPQITKLLPFEANDCLIMDRTTIRNLELTETLYKQEKSNTLFKILDFTKTAMGARKLKNLLKHPYINQDKIEARLDAVDALYQDILSREEIRETLNQVYDLERLISKIVSRHYNPKDCIALKNSLLAIVDLSVILPSLSGELFDSYSQFFQNYNNENSPFQQIVALIEKSILDDPPHTIRDGNFIKLGYCEELDRLADSFKNIKEWISNLESTEREKTGVKTLKVGFNKVFGYYLEITNSQKDKIPNHYIRKQTLTNAERYITPELKEKENIILNGEERQKRLEIELFQDIISDIQKHTASLQELADIIAQLDTIQSLATASQKNNYTRPQFSDAEKLDLQLIESRHPVLEKSPGMHFIPNDLSIDKEKNRFMLITGPNMAGKSTFMRQIALTVIMAQIGCFVPAKQASISIIDKLFTRIGALDNLYAGQSTFMVEMLETASILHNATQNSLILLDEIGRGTSTYDGMSIACAVAEHIHTEIGARTLFATHYHELTSLQDKHPGFSNFNIQISESENNITFTHKCIPGPANRSYGVHVAKLAGLPEKVLDQANILLSGFESEGIHYLKNKNHAQQLSLF